MVLKVSPVGSIEVVKANILRRMELTESGLSGR